MQQRAQFYAVCADTLNRSCLTFYDVIHYNDVISALGSYVFWRNVHFICVTYQHIYLQNFFNAPHMTIRCFTSMSIIIIIIHHINVAHHNQYDHLLIALHWLQTERIPPADRGRQTDIGQTDRQQTHHSSRKLCQPQSPWSRTYTTPDRKDY